MVKNTSDSQLSMIPNDTDLIFKYARFEKGTRYYTVILDKDLFDDWVITVVNGRINTKLGKIRKLAFSNIPDIFERLYNIEKTRIKRGYYIVDQRS